MTRARHATILTLIVVVTGGVIYATLPGKARLGSKKENSTQHAPLPVQTAAVSANAPVHELKVLESQLQQKPDHIPILFRQAQLYREMRKPEEAAKLLRQILTREPKNTQARLELGRALYDLGDVPGAVKETNGVLENDPQNTDALYNLGAIYGNQDNEVLAEEYWNRAVKVNPYSEGANLARQALTRLRVNRPQQTQSAKMSN
ncbi:MAG: tetratricopeptide repeat protein [Terriglobia bacterium]